MRQRSFAVIDGYIGLVSFAFEEAWYALHPGELANIKSPWNRLWFCLHVANFPTLRGGVLYLDRDPSEEDVAKVAGRIADILDTMPQDRDALAKVIREKELAGQPLHFFGGMAPPQKRLEFESFSFGAN